VRLSLLTQKLSLTGLFHIQPIPIITNVKDSKVQELQMSRIQNFRTASLGWCIALVIKNPLLSSRLVLCTRCEGRGFEFRLDTRAPKINSALQKLRRKV
jgi:hypothetical protein